MSHPLSPYAIVAISDDASSVASTLLTPPLTPRDDHDVPYRPTASDRTSLNMKKRKLKKPLGKRREHLNHREQRANSASDSVQVRNQPTRSVKRLNRSKSLSLLYNLQAGGVSPELIQKAVKRLRRWTLPSKSTSTRVFTPLRSTVKQITLSNATESPAMITLRRATTTNPPNRVEMTFFPEPTFGNEKSGLLSYLVSTFSRRNTSRNIEHSTNPFRPRKRSARCDSSQNRPDHPTWTFPAATVCTETNVESNIAMPGAFIPTPPPRRFSTKYVTGDTSFEVIWDENDGSTTTLESSRPSVASARRCSMAVVQLEAQLARSPPESRRSSDQQGLTSSSDSEGSADMLFEQALTPEKLNNILPRLTHELSLRNLPRSRGSGGKRHSECNISTTALNCCVMSNSSLQGHVTGIDCFPPLNDRRASHGNFAGWMVHQNAQQSRRGSSATSLHGSRQRDSRSGSMIGASGHTRRRSSTAVGMKRRQGQLNGRRNSKLVENIATDQTDINEETPLLGQA